jgi:cell division septal protein FtsQ
MYERTYHKTVLKTDEKTPGKRRSHVRINWRLVALLVGIVVVLTGIVIIIRLQKVQVKTITVTGANVVDPADANKHLHHTGRQARTRDQDKFSSLADCGGQSPRLFKADNSSHRISRNLSMVHR